MARVKGTFEFAANYEVKIKGLIDSRMYCPTYNDLLLYTANDYLFNGFPVFVFDTDEEKRGIYQLINVNDLSNPDSWKKITGGGSAAKEAIFADGSESVVNINWTPERQQKYGIGKIETWYMTLPGTLIQTYQNPMMNYTGVFPDIVISSYAVEISGPTLILIS